MFNIERIRSTKNFKTGICFLAKQMFFFPSIKTNPKFKNNIKENNKVFDQNFYK
jgi:hypothetical protein